MTTRKELYHKMAIYRKRREEMREKYWGTPEYRKKVFKINRKLGEWMRQDRQIIERNNKIIAIGNLLATFIGFNVKNSSGGDKTDKRRLLARAIFFKYCLENGINGAVLNEYTNDSRPNTATDVRASFTQSFEKNSENRELYHRFLTYVEERQNTE